MADVIVVNASEGDQVTMEPGEIANGAKGRGSESQCSQEDGPEVVLGFEDVIPNYKPRRKTIDTCLGKIRTWNSLSKLEVAYLAIALLSLGTAIFVTGYSVTWRYGADFTFGIVLLLNAVICVLYLMNGIFYERPYELSVLVVANSIVWLYLVFNYAIGDKDMFKLVRLVVCSVISPLVIVIGVMLARNYSESRNLIFRTVGANATYQDMCHSLFVFMSLLNADLQTSLSLAILVLTSGRTMTTEDKVLLPTALVLGISSFLCGYLGARLENVKLIIIYMILWITMPAYAIFLIVEAAQDLQDTSDDPPMEIAIYAVVFLTAAACLVNRVAILYSGVRVVLNFHKGLKERVYGDLKDEEYNSRHTSGRMSMDPFDGEPCNDRQSIVVSARDETKATPNEGVKVTGANQASVTMVTVADVE